VSRPLGGDRRIITERFLALDERAQPSVEATSVHPLLLRRHCCRQRHDELPPLVLRLGDAELQKAGLEDLLPGGEDELLIVTWSARVER
jgi:hypothetical protein